MSYKKITKFTKIILEVMFWSGIAVVLTSPIWLHLAGTYYSEQIKEHYVMMLLIFAASGVCGVLIVNELRKMMRTVLEERSFIQENVGSLRKMAKISLCISALFIIKTFILPTPATLIIVLVFFIAALFSVVLSCVFQEAINYKEENDLTI